MTTTTMMMKSGHLRTVSELQKHDNSAITVQEDKLVALNDKNCIVRDSRHWSPEACTVAMWSPI